MGDWEVLRRAIVDHVCDCARLNFLDLSSRDGLSLTLRDKQRRRNRINRDEGPAEVSTRFYWSKERMDFSAGSMYHGLVLEVTKSALVVPNVFVRGSRVVSSDQHRESSLELCLDRRDDSAEEELKLKAQQGRGERRNRVKLGSIACASERSCSTSPTATTGDLVFCFLLSHRRRQNVLVSFRRAQGKPCLSFHGRC